MISIALSVHGDRDTVALKASWFEPTDGPLLIHIHSNFGNGVAGKAVCAGGRLESDGIADAGVSVLILSRSMPLNGFVRTSRFLGIDASRQLR